jgi:hypothetical protein
VAERIKDFTPRRGRQPIYPWADWMDGSGWRITRGEDFDVSPESMAQQIRERGRQYSVGVTAYLDGEAVEFRFDAPEEVAA